MTVVTKERQGDAVCTLHQSVHRGAGGERHLDCPSTREYRGLVKSVGIFLFEHHVDDGNSAGNMNRPALQRMLRDAERSLFQGVVVYKTDRLSRNIKDIVKIVLDVLDSHRLVFRSVTEPYDTSRRRRVRRRALRGRG
jgi:hypothetical protein